MLVARWRRGDRSAFSEVAERYGDALGAIAYGIVGDLSLSEDVVQETFVRASKSIGSLQEPWRLGGFLAGIARHVALDMVRKRGRKGVANGLRQRNPRTPAQEAHRRELAGRLREAVSKLATDQREVFLMKYMAGMSYAEIARTLETTREAVGQKLWRIRTKLQQELKDYRP